ncbi:MAG: hypothetical protein ACI9VR_005305 [Cognaticolwellia sp.]|jgi:hypothetical protein
MILFLLACQPPIIDSNPGDTADTESTDDTGDTGPQEPFDCPSLLGFVDGSTRSFQSVDGVDYDFSYTATVATPTVSDDNETLIEVTQISTQVGGGWAQYNATETLSYRCDATGAYYEGLRRDWSGTPEGSTSRSGWLEVEFEGYLYFPMDSSGPWTADWSGTFSDNNGNVVPDARIYTYTPMGEESVTVPAGTYQALKVQRDADGTLSQEWYADGEGLVKTATIERVP